jgi:filamentous hemagglutinin
MANFRNLILAVIAIAAVAGFTFGGKSFYVAPQTGTETLSPSTSNDDSASVVWSHGRGGARANAEEHWEKHGSEFREFHSAREYEEGALQFVRHPPSGTLTKSRENGDTLFYDPATNTFAVADAEGEPRTFFRPDSGRSYWDRQ